LGTAVVVTGAAAEAELASYVAGEGDGRVSVAGETDLGTLLGILAGARLFVSGNTGPMHLAAAVGTPTLSLFAPFRSGSPTRWRPRGENAAVITPAGFACEKCPRERCEHYNCMEAITVETALAEARRVAVKS
jgi:ADP-heptose:LPS heptosyltransferase